MKTNAVYTVSGVVQKNTGRGKDLGYPTANIPLLQDIPEGVYVGYTSIDQTRYPSLIFVGSAVTFGEVTKRCEVHILDFDQDLYGTQIESFLVQKLRDNIRFTNAEELIEQMGKDEQQARNYFENN